MSSAPYFPFSLLTYPATSRAQRSRVAHPKRDECADLGGRLQVGTRVVGLFGTGYDCGGVVVGIYRPASRPPFIWVRWDDTGCVERVNGPELVDEKSAEGILRLAFEGLRRYMRERTRREEEEERE